jgi:hypothetical protein
LCGNPKPKKYAKPKNNFTYVENQVFFGFVCKSDSGLAHFSLPNSLVYWAKWRVILRPRPCTWPLHIVLHKGLEVFLVRNVRL